MDIETKGHLAYIIGVALGDGNLSCPNGRATRLRITCDSKHPELGRKIIDTLKILLPMNSVSVVKRKIPTCFDISVYSNKLNEWMPWQVNAGTKADQKAHVPSWIKESEFFIRECLRGLIQTDGCIYVDRGYTMVNFTNNTDLLTRDVYEMLRALNFRPTYSRISLTNDRYKYSVRVAKDSAALIRELKLYKA